MGAEGNYYLGIKKGTYDKAGMSLEEKKLYHNQGGWVGRCVKIVAGAGVVIASDYIM